MKLPSFTEKGMVRKATPRILEVLRLRRDECKLAQELTVGRSIADLVILKANFARFWPEGPLSIAESAIISSLRKLGRASVDAIAKEVFMQAEPVRRLLLGRLLHWNLVRRTGGEFRSSQASKAWVSQ